MHWSLRTLGLRLQACIALSIRWVCAGQPLPHCWQTTEQYKRHTSEAICAAPQPGCTQTRKWRPWHMGGTGQPTWVSVRVRQGRWSEAFAPAPM
jgi:hypothetical protein